MKNYVISALQASGVSLGVVWIPPDFIPGGTVKIEHVNGTPGSGYIFK